jgi:hypothetical protein
MSSVFERIREEIDLLGNRMQSALEQGKLQLDRSATQRMRSETARELGLLVWRKARGESIDDARHEALLLRLDELQAQLTKLEREMAAARGENVSVGQEPPPGPAT